MAKPGKHRPRLSLDTLKRKFWLLPAAGMAAGAGLGYAAPELDEAFGGVVGVFQAPDRDAARSLLGTIATVTVSVAGISFSVVVVAFTLASQQLSPRALRTFRGDRLSQATLALFLAVFAYALVALATLGSGTNELNLTLTIAVLGAGAAFAVFASFIHNALVSLDPSTLIRRIAADAQELLQHPYPAGIGREAENADRARAELERRAAGGTKVRAPGAGYLTAVEGNALIEELRKSDGVAAQRVPIGDFVVTGAVLAEVATEGDAESLAAAVTGCFLLGDQRTLDQDVAFPVRQLADVALRGLSPSLNDPTTAENAIGSLADTLVRFMERASVGELRADADGKPRFLAVRPGLDDLVRLGFEQVRVKAATYPVVAAQLVRLLAEVERVAREAGLAASEPARQRRLLREAVEDSVPTAADAELVAATDRERRTA